MQGISFGVLVGWFVAALLVRVVLAVPIDQPGYMDAAYYLSIARSLATGQGFTENFIWNYLTHPQSLPQPSNAYWMPLTSLVISPFLWLWGANFRAAQIPMLLLAAALPPLTYVASWDVFRRRDWATHSALLMLCSSFYAPLWGTTDSFALYALVSTGILWLLGRIDAPHDRSRQALVVGTIIALAHLTRADGVLWLVPALVVCLRARCAARATTMLCLGYGTLMAPWFIRNILAFGSPLVGGAAFARSYDDLFFFERPLTFSYWLGAGIFTIIGNVARALLLNIGTMMGGLFVAYFPLAFVGAWLAKGNPAVRSGIMYLGVMYGVLSTVFAVVSWRGTMLHSLTGVLPLLYALAPAGLSSTVSAIAARRTAWRAANAERLFATALLLGAAAVSGWFYVSQVRGNSITAPWSQRESAYREASAWLSRMKEPTEPVMCVNPPGYSYQTGSPAVAIPSDSVEAVVAAARRFGVRYLLLERDHPRALSQVYSNPNSDSRFTPRAGFRDETGDLVHLLEIR